MLENMRTRLGVVGELLAYLWSHKLWWLIPMVIMLLLFGIDLIVAQGSSLAPFIYTLF